MEVMGLMLGEFVDDYTVQVIDVFAMPQSGTTVSVESVDHVFQTRMVDMLKQTGRCACYLRQPVQILTPNLKTGICCRMVPFPSRIRMLAIKCRYQYAAGQSNLLENFARGLTNIYSVFRAIDFTFGCCGYRPNSISERKGRYRRLPPDKPSYRHERPRTSSDDVEHRTH